MKFTTFFNAALLAATVFASPRPENTLKKRTAIDSDGQAGAVIKPDSGKSFNSVTGTIKVPGLSGTHAETVSAWIGIDGIDASGNLEAHVVQTGVDMTIGSDGKATYVGWYEWYPNTLTNFKNPSLEIEKGHEIVMTLAITGSGTSAVATLKNVHTNKEVSETLYSPDEGYDATGIDAEWVIEQPPRQKLADFGTIEFTHCSATDDKKKSYDLSGAHAITLKQDSKTLAEGSVHGTTVKVEYKK